MAKSGNSVGRAAPELPKCPSGIQGLDEVTFGGLPKGRPTLVCGGAGCGKTLLANNKQVCILPINAVCSPKSLYSCPIIVSISAQ